MERLRGKGTARETDGMTTEQLMELLRDEWPAGPHPVCRDRSVAAGPTLAGAHKSEMPS